jgi:hypothetical protein
MIVWLAIGLALAALAAVAPLKWAAAVVIVVLPFVGTALYMVGGDPIVLPLVVSLGFLARHAATLLNRQIRGQFFSLLSGDLPLVGFAGYCVVSGVLFPRVFAGQTMVVPQFGLAATLGPEHASYVQIVYLLLAVWLFWALRHAMLRKGMEFVVLAIMAQVVLIGGFGLVQALLGLVNVVVPVGWIVNNAGYALLTQTQIAGFSRVTSIFVEASFYAVWATGALAFCYALYVNRILPRLNLALAAMIALTMVLSTSTTAYVGLLVVGALGLGYALFDTDQRRQQRSVVMVFAGGVLALILAVLVFTAQDGFLLALRNMIEEMTIRKSETGSGIERARWAQSALQNAADTYYLGAGYGAVRSSGLIFQLIGTVGAPGLILFVVAMGGLVAQAFRRPRTGEGAVVAAGGFALIAIMGAMAAASPDLGLSSMMWVFAALAAAPTALRAAQRRKQDQEESVVGDMEEPAPAEEGA